MTKRGKIFHLVVNEERIACRFPADLWERIAEAAKKRGQKNISQLIKIELCDEWGIDPPNEILLYKKIAEKAPRPKRSGELKLSSAIVETMKYRPL